MTLFSMDNEDQTLAKAEDTIFRTRHKYRAFLLLFALLLHILLQGTEVGGRTLPILLRSFIIIAAIFMTADSRKHLIIGLALGIPGLAFAINVGRMDNHPLELIAYLIIVALYGYVFYLMLARIFAAKIITLDILGLALCTYFLLGSVWVLFYTPVVVADPNAFSRPILQDPDPLNTLTYFSYVTLTTLGYGDLSPVSVLARNLAVLEALTGTLFLAVLISRLVGAYGKGGREKAPEEKEKRSEISS